MVLCSYGSPCLLILQALIDRQELQDQELQQTFDSLSQLLKDSNHKVCVRYLCMLMVKAI